MLAVVHDDEEEVAAMEVGEYEGNDREGAVGWKTVVATECWNDIPLHKHVVRTCPRGGPGTEEIVGEVAKGMVLLPSPAVIEIEVENGEVDPSIVVERVELDNGGLPKHWAREALCYKQCQHRTQRCEDRRAGLP